MTSTNSMQFHRCHARTLERENTGTQTQNHKRDIIKKNFRQILIRKILLSLEN